MQTQPSRNAAKLEVVLRRQNGRFVKAFPVRSRYQAKKKSEKLDEQYDSGYYTEVRPVK